MNLGIFLSPGDSLFKQKQTGQLDRLINYYLKPYIQIFDKVFVFSYGDLGFKTVLPSGVELVAKPKLIINYCYQLLLPFIHYRTIRRIDAFRVFQSPGAVPAVISKLFFKKPYAVTYGYDYFYFMRSEKRYWLALILKVVVFLSLKFADKVIVTFPENLKIKKSVLIPNGVDPSEFKPGRAREEYLVLAVGRLTRQKNYRLLIKAVGRSRFRAKIKLVIIGRGQERLLLLKFAKKLRVNLKIVDNLEHKQLVVWYQSAAIFAMTSRYEGHPKTLIEALSCGCPTLTTQFSGNLIVDGKTGLIGRDVNTLARAIDNLLGDKYWAEKLGAAARQLAVEKYNIKKLISTEIKLLASL